MNLLWRDLAKELELNLNESKDERGVSLFLGKQSKGSIMTVKVDRTSNNMIIGGITGSGKTNLLYNIVA